MVHRSLSDVIGLSGNSVVLFGDLYD